MPLRTGFVHIPKTAGTSFVSALRRGLGAEAVCHAGTPDATAALRRTLADGTLADNVAIVSGHMAASELAAHGYVSALYAVLREPVERAISFYKHISTRPEHPLHARAGSGSLEHHLHWLLDHPEVARTLMQTHYVNRPDVHLYRVEDAQEALDAILRRHGGRSVKMPHLNVIKQAIVPSREAMRMIGTLYANDFGLYESVTL